MEKIYLLLLGIIILFGVHSVSSFVGFRDKVISRLGKIIYKGLYSIIALIGLILIINGMSYAEYKPIWEPPSWSRNVVMIAMLPTFYLVITAYIKSNIKRFIRHPMLLGVLLWSFVHLFANGYLSSILLFGSFAIFSLLGMASANRRGALLQKEIYPIAKDVVCVIAGLVVYVAFVLFIHPK